MMGYYLAENNAEEIQQIIGRVNALHDWMKTQKYSLDITEVSMIMGFKDIPLKEKGDIDG